MTRLVFEVKDFGHCSAGCDNAPLRHTQTVDVELPLALELLLLRGDLHHGYEYAQLIGCEVLND